MDRPLRGWALSLKNISTAALLLTLALYLPVLTLLAPFLSLDLEALVPVLIDSVEVPAAFVSTLISTLGSTLIALILSFLFAGALVFTPAYQRFTGRLPLLLAIPHLAFAVGLYLLLSPKGWLERALAPLGFNWDAVVMVQDAGGISLAIALGIKESWFLCWMIWAQMQRHHFADQYLLAQTFGYGRFQIVWSVLVPQLLPKLRWPLIAVAAYSLSSVEMAWVLGPTHPPTLAVLAWNWLLNPVAERRELGLLLTLVLMLMLLVTAAVIWLLPQLLQRRLPSGRRLAAPPAIGHPLLRGLLVLHLLIGMLVLFWSVAQSWFYPALLPGRWSLSAWQSIALEPFINALSLGLVSALVAILLVLLVLELGFKRTEWMLLPLFLPVLPLVVGQYQLTLWLELSPSWVAVLMAHMLWVLPYVYLVLKPAYQALPADQLLCARTLGLGPMALLLRIKCPLLLRPLCAALALGFSVSLAQYLPTIFIGAGRIDTLTTETLTRFAGGDKRLLGAQTLVLVLLAFAVYLLAQRLPQILYRKREAMH